MTEAYVGENQIVETSKVHGTKVAIAYTADGMYSVAIADKKQATAYASTFGAGTAFTPDDVLAAAKTWAEAYATATRLTAEAWAAAGAGAKGATSNGIAVAASASAAHARIEIRIIKPYRNGESSSAMSCAVTVHDGDAWRKLPGEARRRASSCECVTVRTDEDNQVSYDRLCPFEERAIYSAVLQ